MAGLGDGAAEGGSLGGERHDRQTGSVGDGDSAPKTNEPDVPRDTFELELARLALERGNRHISADRARSARQSVRGEGDWPYMRTPER